MTHHEHPDDAPVRAFLAHIGRTGQPPDDETWQAAMGLTIDVGGGERKLLADCTADDLESWTAQHHRASAEHFASEN